MMKYFVCILVLAVVGIQAGLVVPNETNVGTVQCDLCKTVMKELEGLIQKDSTKKEIETAVEHVCNILPASFKSECESLIEENGGQIIDALINSVSTEKICQVIKLCSTGENVTV